MNKKIVSVGIDLGTTTCVVSVYDPITKQNSIIDINGLTYQPSVVEFKVINGKAIPVNVGIEAVNNAAANPHNTVFNSKRFFALSSDEILPQIPAGVKNHRILTVKDLEETAKVGYKPVLKDGKVMIELLGDHNEKVYITPVDTAIALLQALKKHVLQFFHTTDEETSINAVITVPAYFNNYQREQVKSAGEIAGFNVLRIINEPTAAALSRSEKLNGAKNLLVVDLGGGTFDVSLLQTDKDGDATTMEVKVTEGHLALGGSDFDNEIIKFIQSEFNALNLVDANGKKIDISSKEKMSRVMELAEKTKKILSDKDQVSINLSSIDVNIPSNTRILLTRNRFNQLISKYLNEVKEMTQSVINQCGVNKDDITMLLTGGSTRIPAVVETFKSFGIKFLSEQRPDYDVSFGASRLSSNLTTGDNSKVLLIDVTPVSLGIETLGGVFTPVITKNTSIPTKQTQVFSTAADNQTSVTIRVYQGERAMAKDNRFLDQFELGGIPPAPRGVPVIEVTFGLDANGIVNVSAREKNTGQEAKITVNSTMKDEDLKKMKENAESFKEYDEKLQKNIQLRNTVDNKIYEAKKVIKDNETKISSELKSEIETAIKATEEEIAKYNDFALLNYEELETQSNNLSNAVMKVYENIASQQKTEEPNANAEKTEENPSNS